MPAERESLTPETARAYLDSGGAFCPYCRSDDIEAGPLEAEGGEASRAVECLACGETWHELFKLSEVFADNVERMGR